MAAGGRFTEPTARALTAMYPTNSSPYRVYFDHGHEARRLYCRFGPDYIPPRALRHLAWVDIIIAEPASGKVHHIIEIEDSSSNPKTLIADIMAVLLGDGFAFAGRHDWQVGAWTTLSVMAYRSKGPTPTYVARLEHIKHHCNDVRRHLSTRNAALGHIQLAIFRDLTELVDKLIAVSPAPHAAQSP